MNEKQKKIGGAKGKVGETRGRSKFLPRRQKSIKNNKMVYTKGIVSYQTLKEKELGS